jgi:hypothetical protein
MKDWCKSVLSQWRGLGYPSLGDWPPQRIGLGLLDFACGIMMGVVMMSKPPISKWTLKIEVREDGLKTTASQKVFPRILPPQITTEQMTQDQTHEVLSGLELAQSGQLARSLSAIG